MRHPKNELYVVNNTFVNDYANTSRFIAVPEGVAPVRVVNNIFVGIGALVNRQVEMQSNLSVNDAGLVDRSGFDYRLRKNSPAINAGSDPGSANGLKLVPEWHYVHPLRRAVRTIVDGTIDIGAYEFTGDTAFHRGTSVPASN